MLKRNTLFSAIAVCFLIACSKGNDAPAAPTAASDSATVAPTATSTGKVLTVATELHYPPFNIANAKGEPSGFDNELIREIAKQEGYDDVKFVVVPWKGILDTVNNGQADVVSAGLTMSNARHQQVDFSDPYFYSGQDAIVKKNGKIKSFDNIKDTKVGVQTDFISDTEWVTDLGLNPENVLREETVFANLKDLLSGKVDAVLAHSGIADFYVKKYENNGGITIINNPNAKPADFAYAVKKGNADLLQKLNDGLAKVRTNGTYDKLHAQWFGGMNIGKNPKSTN